jgi:holo-[acyl-carrier protein] synthase
MSADRPITAPSGAAWTGQVPLVRVGVDLVVVDEVRRSLERLGSRYLTRLFTDHEVACCTSGEVVDAEPLAARFAAKEAVLKVLRPDGARPEWRDIEVRRNANGSCDVQLHGVAAAMADLEAVEAMSVSLSHEAGMAVAVVAATCRSSCPSGDASTDREQGEEG